MLKMAENCRPCSLYRGHLRSFFMEWLGESERGDIWLAWLSVMVCFLDVHYDLMVLVVLCVSVLFDFLEHLGSIADLLPFCPVSGRLRASNQFFSFLPSSPKAFGLSFLLECPLFSYSSYY